MNLRVCEIVALIPDSEEISLIDYETRQRVNLNEITLRLRVVLIVSNLNKKGINLLVTTRNKMRLCELANGGLLAHEKN